MLNSFFEHKAGILGNNPGHFTNLVSYFKEDKGKIIYG